MFIYVYIHLYVYAWIYVYVNKYIHINVCIYQPTISIYPEYRKSQGYPIKMRNKTGLLTIPTPSNTVLEALSLWAIKEENEIKGVQSGWVKKSNYPHLHTDVTLYIGGPKNPARKLLKMIKNVSKVAEYKINVYNSATFLYINKKHAKK